MKGSRETTENVQWCMAKKVRKQQKALGNYRMNYRNDRKARESDRKSQKTTEHNVNGGKSDRKTEKSGECCMKKYGEQI